MRTWCDPAGQHRAACVGYSDPTRQELDTAAHVQWGVRREDFFASSLEQCKAKCSADVRCAAVSYRPPVSQPTAAAPNCLPTLGAYEGSFEAAGWDCLAKGAPLDAAAAPDEDAILLAITTSSADADYDQLPVPPVRLASRAQRSLVVSPVMCAAAF